MSERVHGFCVQRGYRGREVNAVLSAAPAMGLRVVHEDVALDGWVPVGTVEFCEPAFGRHGRDFYPKFLQHLLHREVVCIQFGMLYAPKFVKDATAWKSDFESGMRPAGTILPDDRAWLVSDPVTFVDEWRYYVAAGRVVTTGWYSGEDEESPAPELDVSWPPGFSGAVDFGTLDDGRVALVEAHAPFACGWYGADHRDYAEWLVEAWQCRDWWRLDS